jgi:DNA-binding NtrC family response regulator
VPRLAERREDILPLARLFLRRACEELGRAQPELDVEASRLLHGSDWPGNVRELRNVIDRAMVIAQGRTITVEDLPKKIRETPPPPKSEEDIKDRESTEEILQTDSDLDGDFKSRVQGFESKLIRTALQQAGWNQTKAAKELGIPLRTLVRKIKAYGLEP